MQPNRIPLIWGIFLLGIGLTIAAILLTTPPPAPLFQGEVPPRVQTFETMKADGGYGIYLEDQPAGQSTVSVGFAVCSSCFVVIFDNANGVPGTQMGASMFLAEGGEHVSISLEEPLVSDEVYYAMLRKDNGDGVYEPSMDPPLTNTSGVTALMSFLALSGSEPETASVLP